MLVVPYSAGITLGSDMTITLTSNNPSFGGRVRKSLTSSEFTKRQQSIKVLATGDAALATDESIRVQIYVGYL